jgi:hypothetical protein
MRKRGWIYPSINSQRNTLSLSLSTLEGSSARFLAAVERQSKFLTGSDGSSLKWRLKGILMGMSNLSTKKNWMGYLKKCAWMKKVFLKETAGSAGAQLVHSDGTSSGNSAISDSNDRDQKYRIISTIRERTSPPAAEASVFHPLLL